MKCPNCGYEFSVNEHELAVNDIPAVTFSIPHYQRGYRWTEKEVTALLDDLLAFAQSDTSEEVYCLQPLVLQETADGINVVDGQQRLTTIAIILRTLGVKPVWDIKYTCEKGQQLSDLIKPDKKIESINDSFRKNAREAVENWLKQDPSRQDTLCDLLNGIGKKKVIFLLHEPSGEDGHTVFQRMNAGKTPLTSSELIRALYMEAGNGLSDSEKTDIAKEWDLIESAMTDEQFWAIWNNRDFRDVPTRMDFLFSVILNVKSEEARHNPLCVYSCFEKSVLNEKDLADNLRSQWEEILRCWWWMQSCHADVEAFHLLGWLSLFTKRETRVLYSEWKEESQIKSFKLALRTSVAVSIGDNSFDSFRYGDCDSETLCKVFVLLNMLEAERHGIRFRFDLYRNDTWDVEHIASQTDNPLDKDESREEWLRLTNAEKSDKVVEDKDKDEMGNLALLDSGTNRSYKNEIFPAKRRRILQEARGNGVYVPPCTEAAFTKSYSPEAAQMRYWGESDAANYHAVMKHLFENFMEEVKCAKFTH